MSEAPRARAHCRQPRANERASASRAAALSSPTAEAAPQVPAATYQQALQQALQQGRHVATVCDAIYQRWADEVAALPARKQRRWSGWIADKYGCRATVRYAPQEAGLGVRTLFEERLSAKSAADRGLPAGSWIPVQSVSLRAAKAAAARELGGELLIANTATAPSSGLPRTTPSTSRGRGPRWPSGALATTARACTR
jgi:hypothetical protein